MSARPIAIVPPSAFTLRFLYGVAIAFAAFVVFLYFRSAAGLPPERAHEQLAGMAGMIGFDIFFVGVITWAVRRRSVTLTDDALTIKAAFYTRTIPRALLRIESGFVASLLDQRDIAPRWRTNGVRVPGFRAGWFRLVKGERALVLLTDPAVVTYLPTGAGYSLLISTSELLRALEPTPASGA